MAEEAKAPATEDTPKKRKWFPLESNPDVCNKYIEALGWPVAQYSFYELMSTEDWAVDMIPKPVLAILLLFPITERSESFKAE